MAGAHPDAISEAQQFLSSFECLSPGEMTSHIYGRFRAGLQKMGVKLPDPDYWIAAHAVENSLPLITTDSHFNQIPGLQRYLIKV
jgi:predicted nucleic acid-binding protein